MYPSLLLVFAIALTSLPPPVAQEVMATEYAVDHQREMAIIFEVWEEWEKVLAVPISHPGTFEQATSESGLATHMGNGTSDVERFRGLVASQFPANQVENALCVIRSESGGEPHIRNLEGSNARGLFQIMTTVWADNFGFSTEDFYDPSLNTYAAARIWESQGWGPWSGRTRRNCGL